MVQSMTGFASQAGTADGVAWTIELRSVNAKGLDIRMRLPEAMQADEAKLRAKIAETAFRGNVNLTIRLEQEEAGANLQVDDATLDAYLKAAIRVRFRAKEQGLKLEPSRAVDFLGLRGVMATQDLSSQPLPTVAIADSFAKALSSFAQMRTTEGAALETVLQTQITEIESLTAQAKDLAFARRDHVARSLRDNLARVLDNSDGADADRVAQELAMLAVKADVQEEIDRLGAHVSAARDLLAQDGAVGRKLDFLMQEFNREANTLCSKSNDTDLTRVGLDLKAVIDQMREQVQNVE